MRLDKPMITQLMWYEAEKSEASDFYIQSFQTTCLSWEPSSLGLEVPVTGGQLTNYYGMNKCHEGSPRSLSANTSQNSVTQCCEE